MSLFPIAVSISAKYSRKHSFSINSFSRSDLICLSSWYSFLRKCNSSSKPLSSFLDRSNSSWIESSSLLNASCSSPKSFLCSSKILCAFSKSSLASFCVLQIFSSKVSSTLSSSSLASCRCFNVSSLDAILLCNSCISLILRSIIAFIFTSSISFCSFRLPLSP